MSERLLNRLVFGFGDQAVSSLSNVMLAVAVARVVSPAQFGAFSVGLTSIMFVVGVQRIALGTLMSVRTTERDIGFDARDVQVIFGVSFIFVVVGIVTTTAAGILTQALETLPLLYAVMMVLGPLVALQDVLRFTAVSFRRAPIAFCSDSIWLAFLLLPFGADVLTQSVRLGAGTYLALWLTGMFAGLLILLLALRARPAFRDARRSIRAFRRDLVRLLAEGVLTYVVPFIVAGLTAAFLSLQATAGLRGANLLLGPLAVLYSAMPLVIVPELTSRSRKDRRVMERWLLAFLVGMALSWGALLALLPEDVGRALLGPSWTWASLVIPITALEYVVMATYSVPISALKAAGRFGGTLLVKSVHVSVSLVAIAVAIGVGGGMRAVAAALVVSAVATSISAWTLEHRARRALLDGNAA